MSRWRDSGEISSPFLSMKRFSCHFYTVGCRHSKVFSSDFQNYRLRCWRKSITIITHQLHTHSWDTLQRDDAPARAFHWYRRRVAVDTYETPNTLFCLLSLSLSFSCSLSPRHRREIDLWRFSWAHGRMHAACFETAHNNFEIECWVAVGAVSSALHIIRISVWRSVCVLRRLIESNLFLYFERIKRRNFFSYF